MTTYRNKTTGETATLTPDQAARFFDNRDVRDWNLMEDEGAADIAKLFPIKARFGETVHFVPRADYDALAAKLAEVEAERNHWETVAIARQAKQQAAEARNAELGEAVAYATQRFTKAEAALVAAYRLALGDAAAWLDSQALSVEELEQGYGFTVDYPDIAARAIRSLPTPTAAELMARISEGVAE